MVLACKKPKPSDSPIAPTDIEALRLACAWAKGAGETTTGGNGGQVYYVTTLSDEVDQVSGKPLAGTLRYALEQSNPRIILFRVSGIIHLKSPLKVRSGSFTIYGQSAPGDGICIADYPLIITANNCIVRFLRFRMGAKGSLADEEEYDALSVNNATNVIIDHCSCSWSVDECVSCYGNKNFTMQYCYITESLRNCGHSKGNHGYGGIWGGENVSFHHNLIAHHDSRNPRFDHDYVTSKVKNTQMKVDFINNVVYNWGGNSAYGGESASKSGNQRCINYINNYYKPGPATKSGVKARLLNPTTKCGNCADSQGGTVIPGKFYLVGNYMYGSNDVTADNWSGVFPDESGKKSQCQADARFTFDNAYTQEQSAQEAYETVLTKAGCSLHRDAIDERIVREVRDQNATYSGSKSQVRGIIDLPEDVGGWPTYAQGTIPQDSDGDGMPDDWETKHALNPNKYSDATQQTLVSGHTNLEVYLNDLVKHLY